MPWKTNTVANAEAAYDEIVASLINVTFMGADVWSKLWEHDLTDATGLSGIYRRKSTVFEAPGKSGEKIHLAFALSDVVAVGVTNTAFYRGASMASYDNLGLASGTYVGVWSSASVVHVVGDIVTTSTTEAWVCIVPHTSSASNGPTSGYGYWRACGSVAGGGVYTHYSDPIGYIKSWNGDGGDLTYWLFANAQCAKVVFRSGTTDRRYHMAYLGCLDRAGDIDVNPFPVITTSNGSATAYTDTDDGMFPSIYRDSSSPLIGRHDFSLVPHDTYSTVRTYAGITKPSITGGVVMKPIFVVLTGTSDVDRGLLGVADGVFRVDAQAGMQSEDEVVVTVAPCTVERYILFNDVYRGEGSFFIAIKKE